MTDLELTKLAAEAVDLTLSRDLVCYITPRQDRYLPLTDAAQAFELMEKLRIHTQWEYEGVVRSHIWDKTGEPIAWTDWHTDLKRAIVECAARFSLWKRENAK